MEEEKAAAYYDELLQKGGGAARFKQGLGYGSNKESEVSFSKAETRSLMSNFVRQASPGRASAIQKEIALDGIRNKLQKPQDARKADDKSKTFNERGRSRSPSLEKCSKSSSRLSREKNRDRHRDYQRSRSPPKRRSSSCSPLSDSNENEGRTRRKYSRGKERSRYQSHRRRSISRSPVSDCSEDRERARKVQSRKKLHRGRSPSPRERYINKKLLDDRYGSSQRENERSKNSSHSDKRRSSRSRSPRKDRNKKDRERYEGSKEACDRKTGFKNKVHLQPPKESDPKAVAEKVKAKMKLQLLETGKYPIKVRPRDLWTYLQHLDIDMCSCKG
ncbi:hypothetical protein O6H91_07G046600 [Diphasiastrum complanatum]|uniref:Uncharacterized protein n=1 Tax=Diphasiastrum complanatum TaxID=34168 RepID=A0ACC2D4V3_DIPCM|nr:hypothetical protein O6H91_07G046600 [Diphasiastrum complanatum]